MRSVPQALTELNGVNAGMLVAYSGVDGTMWPVHTGKPMRSAATFRKVFMFPVVAGGAV
jgi:hypothetical protein